MCAADPNLRGAGSDVVMALLYTMWPREGYVLPSGSRYTPAPSCSISIISFVYTEEK